MTTTSPRRRLLGRRRGSAVALAAVLAVAGCATIPMSGPVIQGDAVAPDLAPIYVGRPDGPVPEASPQRIVTGFLDAQAAGPTSGFDVAAEFLVHGLADQWDPDVQVLIYDGDPGWTVDGSTLQAGTTTVRGTLTVVGTLDQHGVFTEELRGATKDVVFGLRRDETGEWRISEAEDGLVMSMTNFDISYRQIRLYFPTPDRLFLVPDERWFPLRNWQTYAVRETLAGPAAWLSEGVISVVPEGTALSIDSVAVDPATGTATVNLTQQVAEAPVEDRAMLKAQLAAVLVEAISRTRVLPVVRSVDIYAGQNLLSIENSPDASRSVSSGSPLVIADGGLMQLDGSRLETVPDVSPTTELQPTALGRADGEGPVVVRDGSDRIVQLGVAGEESMELLTGEGLVAPTVDRFGWVWSGPETQGGGLTAARSAQEAVGGVARTQVEAPWLADRTVVSVRVAHDGARVAILSSGVTGTQVDVASIVRDGGRPVRLSTPVRVGTPITDATQLVWADESLLAVLGREQSGEERTVYLVPVGGDTQILPITVEDVVSIAAGRGDRSILLGAADGTLYRREVGTIWNPVATDVSLPAFPG